MNRRILITGVTGFLGSHLASSLVKEGYEVVALKRKSSDLTRIHGLLPDLTLFDVDEINFSSLFSICRDIDAIIHTATNYGRNAELPSDVHEANTVFPLKLLEASDRAGIRMFINTDTILDKYLNLYALSKNQFLQWGSYFAKKNKMHFVNMKLEHFYGPGDDDSKFTSYVINHCINNSPSLELTPGNQCRDFIYIDDVVSAYLTVLEHAALDNQWFMEFEVGSGESVSIREFVEKVHQMTNSNTRLVFGAIPYREGEVMNSRADIHALTSLGWHCEYDLDRGLEMTIRAWKE